MSFIIESNRDEMKRNKKESYEKNVFVEANIFMNRNLIKTSFVKSNKSNRYIDFEHFSNLLKMQNRHYFLER